MTADWTACAWGPGPLQDRAARVPVRTHPGPRRRGRGRRSRSTDLRLAFVAVLAAVTTPTAQAQDRLTRTFGPENGLAAPPVWAVAQDSIGFLWIGTQGGLFRFDGAEFRRWAPDSIRNPVGHVTVSPDGRVAALEIGGRAFAVTADGARGIAPDVAGSDAESALVYDGRGVLWFLHGNTLQRRPPGGHWQALPAASFDGETLHALVPNYAGAIDVLTRRSVWRLSPDEGPRLLLRDVVPWAAASTADGRTFVLVEDDVVELSRPGDILRSWPIPTRGRRIAIAERFGTTWVSLDNALLALRPGERADVRTYGGRVAYGGRVTYGGPLMVDREGSLWLASNALHQFPEPETRIVTALDGHGLSSSRFLDPRRHQHGRAGRRDGVGRHTQRWIARVRCPGVAAASDG
jgi:Two component regulator propeller